MTNNQTENRVRLSPKDFMGQPHATTHDDLYDDVTTSPS